MFSEMRPLIMLLILCLSSCAKGNGYKDLHDDAQLKHLLNRVSFGPSAAALAELKKTGVNAYLEAQLKPDSLPKSAELEQRLAALTTLDTPLEVLSQEFEPPTDQLNAMSEEERKQVNKNKNKIPHELAQAKILRGILSPAQLQEVMTDFWFNHFNVFAEKGADKIWIGSYEREAIRPHALGKFRDLLTATAQHPAMLFYLDNWLNVAPDIGNPDKPRKNGINENYAREIMELHTLGVDGGYTQLDVRTLAEILTGWGLTGGKELWQRAKFKFNPQRHDFEDKLFLGHKLAGNAKQEIEAAIEILASHPATAKHIAYQLAQAFVADQPPPALVDELSKTFRDTDGNIASVLRTLFNSDDFWDSRYAQNKFKPPFRFAVSAFRAGEFTPPGDTQMIQGALRNMGQPLYQCPTPNGYPNTKEQWLNPDALLKRIEFSKKLAGFLDKKNAASEILASFGEAWSKTTLDAVNSAAPGLQPVLLFNSPEFLYY